MSLLKPFATVIVLITVSLTFAQNNPPVFDLSTNDYSIDEGSSLIIPLNALDADDDLIIQNPRVAVIGSSTATGSRASSGANSWVGLFRSYLDENAPNHQFERFAKGGYTSYHFREDGYIPSISGRPLPDQTINISRVVEFNPDLLIVNLPSNDVTYQFDAQETWDNFDMYEQFANSVGSLVYFHTNQPKSYPEPGRNRQLEDKANYIKETYQDRAIVTYDSLVNYSNYNLKPEYDADGTHPNDAGHALIFRQNVRATEHLFKTFKSDDLPPFVTLENSLAGQGRVVINTSIGDAGIYSFSIVAEDIRRNKTIQTITLNVGNVPLKGGTQELTSFDYTLNDGGSLDYYVYYPENYDTDSLNKPILISLHGLGERDGDPSKLLSEQNGEGSIAYRANLGEDFPLMVISPHQVKNVGGRDYTFWNIDLIKELIEYVKDRYNADSDRIYLTGFSNGGQAAWQYAVDHSDDLAALVALAGRTDLTVQPQFNKNLSDPVYACELSELPIRVYHSSNDPLISVDQSIDMVNSINACDNDSNAELFLLNDGHEIRPVVYGSTGLDNVYDWMLQYSKGNLPADETAPTFTVMPSVQTISEKSVSIYFQVDESSTIYYSLVEGNVSLSSSEIINGIGISGSINNSTGTTFAIDDLNPATEYTVGIIAEDNAGNRQDFPFNLTFATNQDTSAPIFEIQPTITEKRSGNVSIEVKLDEPGYIYWAIVPQGQLQDLTKIISGDNVLNNDSIETDGSLETINISGLIKNTAYSIQIIASDDEQERNFQSEIRNIDFTTEDIVAEQIGVTYQLNVTASGQTSGIDGWNDLNFKMPNGTGRSFQLVDNNNNVSGKVLTTWNLTNGSGYISTADNGSFLNDKTPFPDKVAQYAAWTSSTALMELSGLEQDKTYDISFFSSRRSSGRYTSFSIYEESKSVLSSNNTSDLVVFEGLQANVQGIIPMSFSKVNTNYGYLNTIIIEELSEQVGDTVLPKPVTGLNADIDINGHALLDWDAPTDLDFSSFILFRSSENLISDDLSFALQTGIFTNTFTDETVLTGSTYYYWIAATDSAGNLSMINSSIEVIVEDENFVESPVLNEIIPTEESISIEWTFPGETSSISKFLILRSDDSSSFQNLAEVTNSIESFTDADVTLDVQYTYVIVAEDVDGNQSAYSNSLSSELIRPILPPNPPVLDDLNLTSDNLPELNWSHDESFGFSHYRIIRSSQTIASITDAEIVGDNITSSTFIDTNVLEEETYFYRVLAVNEEQEDSSPSNELNITIPDLTSPEAPTNLSSSSGVDKITLEWQASISQDVATYNIYRNENGINVPTSQNLLASISSPQRTYDDNSAIESRLYYYAITAVDEAGNESESSNNTFNTTLDTTPPSRPSTPVLVLNSDNSISITWDPNIEADLSEYYLWRSTATFNSTSDAELIASGPGTNFLDSNTLEKSTYFYGVTANDVQGNISDLSTLQSVETNDITSPLSPAGFVATSGVSEIILEWDNNVEADLSGYNIYASAENEEAVILNNLVAFIATNSYNYISNAEEETIFFIVTAVDESGNESTSSDIIGQKILNTVPPNKPATPFLDLNSDNSISITWTDNSEADLFGYNVWRSTSLFNSTAEAVLLSTLSSTSYTDNTTTEKATFFYAITAVDIAGNESIISDVQSIETGDVTPPNSPVGLTATSGVFEIILDWDDNSESDLAAYNIYASTVNDVSSILSNLISTVATSTYSFSYTTEEEMIYFIVTALDNTGNESNAEVVTSQKILNTVPPNIPQGLDAIVLDRNNIQLSWNPSIENDFAFYTIYRSNIPNFAKEAELVLSSSLTQTSYEDPSLQYETAYYYSLTATDIAGNESGLSDIVLVTTEEEAMDPVLTQTININVTAPGKSSGLSNWNDLNFKMPNGEGRNFNLTDAEGNATPKVLSTWSLTNGSGYISTSDNRNSLDNKTPYPNQVVRYAAWTSSTAKMELSGLDQDKTYNISFFSSRTSSNRFTSFTINGESKTILSSNNTSDLVVFEGLEPNEQGIIPMSWSKVNANWGYINAIVIEEFTNPAAASSRTVSAENTKNDQGNPLAESFSSFELYPNPASNLLTIRIPEEMFSGLVTISLMNLNGKTLWSDQVFNTVNEIAVPVSGYIRGLYLIRIADNSHQVMEKVLFE